jgi:hypothetical protein
MLFKRIYTVEGAKKLLFTLIGFELLLITLYFIIHILFATIRWGPLSPLFDLNGELSIPTWFSSVQLFVVGVIFLLTSQQNQESEFPSSRFMIISGLGFIFLSADEAAVIHERITKAAIKLDLKWLLFKNNHGAWIGIYLLLGLILLLAFRRDLQVLWTYFRRESFAILAGALIFLAGCVGIEVISYYINPFPKVEVLFEELFEMTGVTLILYGVMLFSMRISAKNLQEGGSLSKPFIL